MPLISAQLSFTMSFQQVFALQFYQWAYHLTSLSIGEKLDSLTLLKSLMVYGETFFCLCFFGFTLLLDGGLSTGIGRLNWSSVVSLKSTNCSDQVIWRIPYCCQRQRVDFNLQIKALHIFTWMNVNFSFEDVIILMNYLDLYCFTGFWTDLKRPAWRFVIFYLSWLILALQVWNQLKRLRWYVHFWCLILRLFVIVRSGWFYVLYFCLRLRRWG